MVRGIVGIRGRTASHYRGGRLSVAAVVILALSSPSHGQNTIGVNFNGSEGVDTVGELLEPGIVPGAGWIDVSGNENGVDPVPLQDATLTESALMTYTAPATSNSFNKPTIATPMGQSTMYGGGLLTTDAVDTITINVFDIYSDPLDPEFSFDVYDLYVYSSADTTATDVAGTAGDELSITYTDTDTIPSDPAVTFYHFSDGDPNSTATSLTETTGTTALTRTVGPAQYQVFRNLTARSFSLEFKGLAEIPGTPPISRSNNVFGFQIVAVPEPSGALCFALVATISSCAAIWRKRRSILRAVQFRPSRFGE